MWGLMEIGKGHPGDFAIFIMFHYLKKYILSKYRTVVRSDKLYDGYTGIMLFLMLEIFLHI